MLPRVSARFGVIAALAAAAVACKKDPTADGVGTPAVIQAAFASLNVNIGSTGTVTASVVDVRQTPLEAPITFTTCDATIATVAADTSYHPVPVTSARALVKSVLSGTACVVAATPLLTQTDTVVVNVVKATPVVVTNPSVPAGTSTLVGATLADTARLGGGFGTLTGTITFALYDSTQKTCAASPRYTQALTVSAAGLFATSPGFTSDKVGIWRWRVVYGGNANNKSVTTACTGSSAELVVVKAPTTLTTVANPTSGAVGAKLKDAATLGGGAGTPGGTIVFRLYDPTHPACTGTPRLTDSVTVAGVGTYNTSSATGFTTDAAGTWRWTAEYTGDAINAAKSTACNDEQVVIS